MQFIFCMISSILFYLLFNFEITYNGRLKKFELYSYIR